MKSAWFRPTGRRISCSSTAAPPASASARPRAGIPVGTLAIGKAGATNAALLAAAILANGDTNIAANLDRFRAAQTDTVLQQPDPRADDTGQP